MILIGNMLVETEQARNLLEILKYNYFIELGEKLNFKSYEEITKLDKYDYIDYLNQKEIYETLLFTALEKLNNVMQEQDKLIYAIQKVQEVDNGNI